MNRPLRNERGIALVITLIVVALLAITVVEFAFSVQVDQHMARNALNSLQASLLARSGINLGEALLMRDEDPNIDAYSEEWCPQPTEHGCRIDVLDTELVIPENMRLRIEIVDEGGKLNVNMTRPASVHEWRNALNNPNPERLQVFQSWQTVLERLLEVRGADPEAALALAEHWSRLFDANFGEQEAVASEAQPTPRATAGAATPTPGSQQSLLLEMDFASIDDLSVVPGFTPEVIRRMRPVLAAVSWVRQRQVNANTAPREVLEALIGDGGIVDGIITQRLEVPLTAADLIGLLAGVNVEDPSFSNVRSMLGVRSSMFLVRASAVVNPNPVTGRGGIRRTASMLVRRDPRRGVPANAPAGTSRWTLTRLDWQKEGGAELFEERREGEEAVEDQMFGGFGR